MPDLVVRRVVVAMKKLMMYVSIRLPLTLCIPVHVSGACVVYTLHITKMIFTVVNFHLGCIACWSGRTRR